jgi:hypothetical protein
MDITVFNPADGTTITISPGGEGVVTIPQTVGASGGRRVLELRGADAIPSLSAAGITALRSTGWTHWGDLIADTLVMDTEHTTADGDTGEHPICLLSYTLASPQTLGTYWQTVMFREYLGVVDPVETHTFAMYRIKVQVVAPVLFVARRTALPDSAIDLEFDIAAGVVRSANLGLRGLASASFGGAGLAVGSKPTFAVVPSLAGSVLTSSVTAVSLCLRRKDQFEEPKLIEFSGDGTVTGSGDGQHYALSAVLKGAGITAGFADLDDATPDPNNPDRVQVLECQAQLRVTYAGADYVSAPFAVSLFQPVDETLLS